MKRKEKLKNDFNVLIGFLHTLLKFGPICIQVNSYLAKICTLFVIGDEYCMNYIWVISKIVTPKRVGLMAKKEKFY